MKIFLFLNIQNIQRIIIFIRTKECTTAPSSPFLSTNNTTKQGESSDILDDKHPLQK